MFGGNPGNPGSSINPFGGGTFSGGNSGNIFGSASSGGAKTQIARKTGETSGLFGMPPIPNLSGSGPSSGGSGAGGGTGVGGGGLFKQPSLFGAEVKATSPGLFGSTTSSSTTTAIFGSQKKPIFGIPNPLTTTTATATTTTTTTATTGGNIFGSKLGLFGESPAVTKIAQGGGGGAATVFGSGTTSGVFGKPQGLFGMSAVTEQQQQQPPPPPVSKVVFGKSSEAPKEKKILLPPPDLFANQPKVEKPDLFKSEPPPSFPFVTTATAATAGSSLFRSEVEKPDSSLFGQRKPTAGSNLFVKSKPVKSRLGKRLTSPLPTTTTTTTATSIPKVESENESGSEKSLKISPTRLERLTSKEEIMELKSIICERVPEIALKKSYLEKHFSRFGPVVKVTVNFRKGSAIVHFADHKSAKKAKEKGNRISSRIPPIGAIFYSRKTIRTRTISREDEEEEEEEEEVNEELEAMAPPESDENIFSFKRPTKEKESSSSTTSASVTIVKNNMGDLKEKLKSKVYSDQDRFDVLDARDKILRDKRAPRKDGDPPLKGSCPDMCPEHERYSRSAKCQLRCYEKIDGVLNHFAAVKEYSRSSADQDVPLSHELRPGPVLKMTMDHILCNVIDRLENPKGTMAEWYSYLEQHGTTEGFWDTSRERYESIGDWFEYVWSVTRGIRKDITQQQLSDTTAVDLVEKCARFHIVCSERLVEEESHDFARKLNDENLTKCLQTLKHMYYDLSLENVRCPNEPEFRSYEILMNLNDGDTLRDVQTLDKSVREHEDVSFALKVFMALNANNYIKFFKLVRKKASLLQACILLRYFHQVRLKAADTIVKAYCPPKQLVHFQLSKLTEMLAFENDEETARCCRLYGLEPEIESDIIYMERGAFRFPSEIPAPRRAKNLIESKRTKNWSEVINNGPLPLNPYLVYKPHNSFNEETGYLKPEAYEGQDQVRSPEEEDKKQKLELCVLEIVDEIIAEVSDAQTYKMATDVIKFAKLMEAVHGIIDEITVDIIEDVGKETLRECRNEEIGSRLKMMAEAELAEELTDEVTDSMILEISETQMTDVRRRLKYFDISNEAVEDLVNEVIAEDLKLISEASLNEAYERREREVNSLLSRRERRLKQRIFDQWRRSALKSRRHRHILDHFPAIASHNDLETQNEKLQMDLSPKETLNKTLKRLKETELAFESVDVADSLLEKAILEPVNIPDIVPNKLSRDFKWKLLLVVPDLDYEAPGRAVVEMIKRKLNRNDEDNNGLLSCYSTLSSSGFNVSICVRLINDSILSEDIIVSEKRRKEMLMGTSGILFLAFSDEDFRASFERLELLLKNMPRIPPVPLSVITDNIDIERTLKLSEFVVKKKFISAYEVITVPNDVFNIKTVMSLYSSLEYLIRENKSRPDLGLSSKSLRDFVEDVIVSAVMVHFYRRRNKKNPTVLIEYFNSVVDQMLAILTDEGLSEISWPIPEFHAFDFIDGIPCYWNDPTYLDMVSDSIKSLKLPEIKFVDVTNDWSQVTAQISDYFGLIVKSYGDSSSYISRIQKSLLRSCQRAELMINEEDLLVVIDWPEIIHSCIDYKISVMPTVDQFSTQRYEMMVCYFQSRVDSIYVDKTIQDGNDTTTTIIMTISNNSNEVKEKSLIQRKLEEERMHSKAFEERLEKAALDDDDDDDDDHHQLFQSDEEKENDDDVLVLEKREFVPLISYLSPSLGSLVSPVTVTSRLEVLSSGKSPAHSKKKKRKIQNTFKFSDEKVVRKMVPSDLLQDLKDRVRTEKEQSYIFEEKLRNVLS